MYFKVFFVSLVLFLITWVYYKCVVKYEEGVDNPVPGGVVQLMLILVMIVSLIGGIINY